MLSIRDILEWFIRDRFKKERIETLKDILLYNELQYTIQKADCSKNVILFISNSKDEKIVIGAHYDVFEDSVGINDNGVAVSLLIHFAVSLHLENKQKNIEIVFFDKEERGMIGSRDYIQENYRQIDEAIILDIIGYGEEILLSGEMSKNDVMKHSFGAKQLSFALPSDNFNFESIGIPTTLITAASSSDIVDNHDGSYSVGWGASFYRTMHNNDLDNDLSLINFETVERIYNMLHQMYIA